LLFDTPLLYPLTMITLYTFNYKTIKVDYLINFGLNTSTLHTYYIHTYLTTVPNFKAMKCCNASNCKQRNYIYNMYKYK